MSGRSACRPIPAGRRRREGLEDAQSLGIPARSSARGMRASQQHCCRGNRPAPSAKQQATRPDARGACCRRSVGILCEPAAQAKVLSWRARPAWTSVWGRGDKSVFQSFGPVPIRRRRLRYKRSMDMRVLIQAVFADRSCGARAPLAKCRRVGTEAYHYRFSMSLTSLGKTTPALRMQRKPFRLRYRHAIRRRGDARRQSPLKRRTTYGLRLRNRQSERAGTAPVAGLQRRLRSNDGLRQWGAEGGSGSLGGAAGCCRRSGGARSQGGQIELN